MDKFSKIIPAQVLDAYGIAIEAVEAAHSGLINETWFITTNDHQHYVVQRLHSAISPDVNSKIQFVTEHLASQNITTPRIVQTTAGATFCEVNNSRWRLLTFVAGNSVDIVSDVRQAFEAGALLAKFHGALAGASVLGMLSASAVHDLGDHISNLKRALNERSNHLKIAEITELARDILANAQSLPEVQVGERQAVHGDPKISNFLFDETGCGVCLVDLDTVGLMPIAWELGDAFRSWCNPYGEDTDETEFCLNSFKSGLEGYASTLSTPFSDRDVENIVPAVQTIYIELAARFCADALYENYFAWDSEKFPTQADHNVVRARGQLRAAQDLGTKRAAALAIAREVFASRSRL